MLHFGRAAALPEASTMSLTAIALLLVRHRTCKSGLVLWNVNGWLPVSEVRRPMALVPKRSRVTQHYMPSACFSPRLNNILGAWVVNPDLRMSICELK
jgi:hypothetical protein